MAIGSGVNQSNTKYWMYGYGGGVDLQNTEYMGWALEGINDSRHVKAK